MFNKMNTANVHSQERRATHDGTCWTGRIGDAGAQTASALANSILPMKPLTVAADVTVQSLLASLVNELPPPERYTYMIIVLIGLPGISLIGSIAGDTMHFNGFSYTVVKVTYRSKINKLLSVTGYWLQDS